MNGKTLIIGVALMVQPCFAANDAYYNYLQGMAEERAGNTTKALEAYETAVKKDPQALQVYRDIAELRLRMGDPDAALQAAEKVKDLAPTDPTSFIFLGNVRVAQGDLAKAADAYEQALKLDPSNLRALENLGNYYALLEPDKALSYYQRYIELNPRDADIYFQMAILEQKRGQFSKALDLYKQSIDLDSDQLASHLALADLYEQMKSTANAIAEYKVATGMQPTNPLIQMRLGNLLYRDHQWDEAWETYKAVEKMTPQDPSVYYWLARCAEERKDWKEAAQNAEKAYTLSKDNQFLPLVAYYMTLDHQVDSAIKYLEKARALDPENANVLLFLGINYLDSDKLDKAREALAKGVELYPKDVQMRFHLGMAEDRLGHFDAAMEQFQTILKVDPQNGAALNYIGYSWADRGIHLADAEKLLKQAVAIDPDSGAYLDSLGWVRLKQGHASDARHYLELAVMHSPDPLIFDHLGDACMADHHPEAALQAWSRALFLDSKNESIRKKVMKEGTAYFNGPDAKKYLLYLEGNLKQAANLSGHVSFAGKLGKHRLQADGKLSYEQPDKIRLDIGATPKTAAIHYSLDGKARVVDPAAASPAMNQMAFDGLTTLSQFLSGSLTGDIRAVLEPSYGVVTEYSRTNPSGGQDEIRIMAYNFVEGIWLPSLIWVKNSTTGYSAELTLSDWLINSPDKTAATR